MTMDLNDHLSIEDGEYEEVYEDTLMLNDDARDMHQVTVEVINDLDALDRAFLSIESVGTALADMESLSLRAAMIAVDNLDISLARTSIGSEAVYDGVAEEVNEKPGENKVWEFIKEMIKKIIEAMQRFWFAAKAMWTRLTDYYVGARKTLDKQKAMLQEIIKEKRVSDKKEVNVGGAAGALGHKVLNNLTAPILSGQDAIEGLQKLIKVTSSISGKYIPSLIGVMDSLQSYMEAVAKSKKPEIERGRLSDIVSDLNYGALGEIVSQASHGLSIQGLDIQPRSYISPMLPGGYAVVVSMPKDDKNEVSEYDKLATNIHLAHRAKLLKSAPLKLMSTNELKELTGLTEALIDKAHGLYAGRPMDTIRRLGEMQEKTFSYLNKQLEQSNTDALFSGSTRLRYFLMCTSRIHRWGGPFVAQFSEVNRKAVHGALSLTNSMLKAY